MGLTNSRPQLSQEDINRLLDKTNFTEKQIKSLYNRFCQLDKDGNGFVTKEELLNIKQIQANPLGVRIVETFIREANTLNKVDKDEDINENVIKFPEFCAMLGSFNRAKGIETLEDDIEVDRNGDYNRFCKMRFLFDMYDNDGDDRITEVEMLKMLVKMATDPLTGRQRVSEEELWPYAHRALEEMCPHEEEGKRTISFEEFKESMKGINIEDKMSIKF